MLVAMEHFRLPRYREIPDVGLYLDQTVKYINQYLTPLGCMELTTSMVSNYVKKGYIANPVKKQYSADQIAYLFFIAIVKQVTSMDNIARLIEVQEANYTREVAYNYFCNQLENVLHHTFGYKHELERVGTTNTNARRILDSVIVAVVQIIYLNMQLDAYGLSEPRRPDDMDGEAEEA